MASTSLPNSNASDPNNPGNVLASAVDAEIGKFRQMQEKMASLSSDLQIVTSQQAENEMVLQELNLQGSGAVVYKQVGPVLIKQDLEEAQETVQKRLEFIGNEKKSLEQKMKETETKGNELAAKIQKMQASLQQTTADAVRAIAEQHSGSTR